MVGGADRGWCQDAKKVLQTLFNLIFDVEQDGLLLGYNKMTTWSFLAYAPTACPVRRQSHPAAEPDELGYCFNFVFILGR